MLTPAFYPTLDALAALAKTCPSLRVAVSGPADPAKPPATPAAGPAPGRARPPPSRPGSPTPPSRRSPPSRRRPRSRPRQARGAAPHAARNAAKDRGKAETGKAGAAKKEPAASGKAAKKTAEAPDEPPPDLPRLRAQAVVEYLLQAGARPDQVTAGPDGPAGPVVFALLP
ncbi:hypothetical protein ACU4GA_28280 [Methylobacterium oryzae CBMB20]